MSLTGKEDKLIDEYAGEKWKGTYRVRNERKSQANNTDTEWLTVDAVPCVPLYISFYVYIPTQYSSKSVTGKYLVKEHAPLLCNLMTVGCRYVRFDNDGRFEISKILTKFIHFYAITKRKVNCACNVFIIHIIKSRW